MAETQRSVFVTGGASGLGLALAQVFAAEGWLVGLADIDEAGLERAAARLGGDISLHRLDVRDPAAWTRELARFAERSKGRLDVLVNNAGVFLFGPFESADPAAAGALIDINVKGVVFGAMAALPYLKATPSSVLINIASAVSIYGTPQMALYSASKFAVRGLSEALEQEFAPLGVRVACMLPAVIDTPLLDKATAPDGTSFRQAIADWPKISVEDAAQAVWRAVGGQGLHHPVGEQAVGLYQTFMAAHAASAANLAR
jgi:NAD(P)-dependent dehydrogenase (short-subunit alcohol dehydrogenase family)